MMTMIVKETYRHRYCGLCGELIEITCVRNENKDVIFERHRNKVGLLVAIGISDKGVGKMTYPIHFDGEVCEECYNNLMKGSADAINIIKSKKETIKKTTHTKYSNIKNKRVRFLNKFFLKYYSKF